jgi:hypothetical protein
MAGEARIPFDLAPGRVFEKLGDLGKFAGAVRARAGERIMRNKANFAGFGAENGGAAEKQSQFTGARSFTPLRCVQDDRVGAGTSLDRRGVAGGCGHGG